MPNPNGFISDDDMAQMEANANSPQQAASPNGFISDDDMAKMEAQNASTKQPTVSAAQQVAPESKSTLQRLIDYTGGLARTGASMSALGQLAGVLRKGNPYQSGDISKALTGNAPSGDEYLNRLKVPSGDPMYVGNNPFQNPFKEPTPMHMTPRQIGGAAIDTASQMGGNAMAGVAAEAAQPVLNELANSATIAHLRPVPKLAQKLGPQGLTDVAEQVRDSGAMPFGSKVKTTAANLKDLKTGAMDNANMIADASPEVADPQAIADRIKKEVVDPLRQTAEGDPIADKIQAKLDSFTKKYTTFPEGTPPEVEEALKKQGYDPSQPISPSQLAEENRVAYAKMKPQYGQAAINDAPTTEALKGVNSTRKNIINEMVNDPDYTANKKAFGNFADAYKMADKTANIKGLLGHITDAAYLSDAGRRAYYGNPTQAAAELLARYLTKGRMASSIANTAGGLSNVSIPSAAATAATTLPASVWYKMMQQNKGAQQ